MNLFDIINTPQQLSNYMKENIEYAWMDNLGNKRTKLCPEMYYEYRLMSFQEVLKNGYGICLDQVEFERKWFASKGIKFYTFQILLKRKTEHPGHVYLLFEENSKCYWFENAWNNHKGIYEFKTKSDAIMQIKKLFITENNVKENEIKNLYNFEYEGYPFGINYEEIEKIDNINFNKQKKL